MPNIKRACQASKRPVPGYRDHKKPLPAGPLILHLAARMIGMGLTETYLWKIDFEYSSSKTPFY